MKRMFLISFIVLLLALPGTAFGDEPTVSIVFVQNDLRDAVTELTLQTGVNIILDANVQGVVTLDLVDVPLDQALRMLALPGGYEVHKIDDFYFIGTADPASPSFRNFAVTATYQLQHLSAADVAELMPDIYRKYVNTGLYRNIVTIAAPQATLERILELLQQLDQPSQQILIQAVVTEVSRAALEEWGAGLVSYDPSGEKGSSWLDGISYSNSVFSLGVFGKVLASLRALEAEQKAEIHANPRVITTSGKTVDLFSGETHYVVLPTTSNSSSRMEKVNVGLSLNVTPVVVQGNMMRLTISPEISHVSGQLKNNEGLSVRRSAVSTDVYAESGQTLLLAGMTLESSTNQDSHVPILGRLPLIRWFFTDKSDATEERELLILVTAEILPGTTSDAL